MTLPSGASLTVNKDGSFTYVPVFNFVGADTFTFTAADSHNPPSSPGTVTITMMPTLSLVPEGLAAGASGDSVTVDVVLDNPDPPNGAGPLTGFNLAITYDPNELTTAGDGSQIALGMDVPSDWITTVNAITPGVLGIASFGLGVGSDLVTGPAPVVLATLQFTIIGTSAASTDVDLVALAVTPTGDPSTALGNPDGTLFKLEPALPGQVDV